ncbi:MAG: TlpA disulfide reductase family protein [Pirellulales bacterium]
MRFAPLSFAVLSGSLLLIGCGGKADTPPVAKQPAGRPIAKSSEPAKSETTAKPVESGPEKTQPEKSTTTTDDTQIAQAPKPEAPGIPVERPKSQNLVAQGFAPQLPAIFMSEGHTKSLRVGVGQTFPQAALTDAAGKATELKPLLGKFTVVVFWSAKEPAALEELQDLQDRVLDPYKGVGVRVIAINPVDGDKPETKAWLTKAGFTFPTLNDPTAKLFDAVGRGPLPRTFLLDDSGKILWLDIEYSRTTLPPLGRKRTACGVERDLILSAH